MTPTLILGTFLIYTCLLFFITWLTSRNANNETFFIGNKVSPWYVVAYGMIGASLSGVTLMSVPGNVEKSQFSYMMVVFGYFFGYLAIAKILLPLYYRLNLTSIYTYLEQRFGNHSYKTGSVLFIISRVIGASFRMFLVVVVLQQFVFDAWNVPFEVTALIFVSLIILYTLKGGIKTIVYTDTLQTTFMILAVIITIILISNRMNFSFSEMLSRIFDSQYSQIVNTDWHNERFFLKNFLSGMFITIVMTGLDQEMMQKNLSCKNLKEAQKNMFTFSFILVAINFVFLCLGAVLFLFAHSENIPIPAKTDTLFPFLAIHHLGTFAGLVFLIGLISAAYPSADGALTSLTTSFCIDILNFEKMKDWSDAKKVRIRKIVHFSFAAVLLLTVIIFNSINTKSVIDKLLTIAGYTYGPLLGLYAFGLFSKKAVLDKFVPYIAIASPLLCILLANYSELIIPGYKIGFEILIINGLITYTALYTTSHWAKK
jgi:solute:Na+ symporter, SSS family